jgi:hypothetical protein
MISLFSSGHELQELGIFLHFGLGTLSYTFLPVSTQLVVRSSF